MSRQITVRAMLSGFIIIGLVLVVARGCINSFVQPFDLVHVDVNGDIPDVLFCEVVVESNGQVRQLPHYAKKVRFFTLPVADPRKFERSYGDSFNGGSSAVQWVAADRYGVLGLDMSGNWKIWWFYKEDVEIDGLASMPRRAVFHIDQSLDHGIADELFFNSLGFPESPEDLEHD